ncbi:MAG: DivIVA domain-containing protein [Oscillospiraceae bacterium]|nr:DivIVA domain-containing protein [Oscillospiraceae bacterium]
MVGTNISFTREKNGYDRDQVDSYIKKVSEAYQTTYYEYIDVNSKYKKLLEERDDHGAQGSTGMNSEVAAKTLISTEKLAQSIIADAQTEASGIIDDAKQNIASAQAEADSIIADAQKRLADARAEVALMKEQARTIISDAEAEAAELRAAGKKIIDDANNEVNTIAAQVRSKTERAREVMARAAAEVDGILNSR